VAHVGRSWASFSADGRKILSHGEDGEIGVWSAQDGQEELRLRPLQGQIWAASFDSTGTRIASGGQDGSVVISSLTGKSPETLIGHGAGEGAIYDVVFSPDGKSLVTGSESGTLHLWTLDEKARKDVVLAGHRGAVTAVAYSADSTQIASAGVDGTIHLWSSTGVSLAILRGHQGAVDSVHFTPDGTRVIGGGSDGTISVWDVGQARLLVTLTELDHAISSVDVSSDGHWVLTASEEGAAVRITHCDVCGSLVSVLDLARKRAIRSLTAEEEQRFAS